MLVYSIVNVGLTCSFVIFLKLRGLGSKVFLDYHGFIFLRRFARVRWRFWFIRFRRPFFAEEICLLLGYIPNHSLRRNNVNPILRQHFTRVVIFRRKIKSIFKWSYLSFSNIDRSVCAHHSNVKPKITTLIVFPTEHAVQTNFCHVRRPEFFERIVSTCEFNLVFI